MTKMISCLRIGSHKYNIQYVTCLCRMSCQPRSQLYEEQYMLQNYKTVITK